MRYFLALLSALFAISIPPAAQAEKRIALVIGNSAYQATPELKNSRNDAADMAAVLTRNDSKHTIPDSWAKPQSD